jgi:hypothetical protein
LPDYLLNELKVLANRRDVPYQSLLKVFLAERVQQELNALVAREGTVDYSVARMPRKRKKAGLTAQKPVKRLHKPA